LSLLVRGTRRLHAGPELCLGSFPLFSCWDFRNLFWGAGGRLRRTIFADAFHLRGGDRRGGYGGR
jgi:hypothetical protein